jgi:hypothetical protein
MAPVVEAHFEPGHRFLNWTVVQFSGHEWAAALAIGATAIGAATLGVILVAREIGSSSALAIVVGAGFGSWIGWSRIELWWANGAQTLPAIALMAWTICTALAWDRKGRRHRGLALTTGLLILAFCFSVRSALAIPIIAVLLLIVQPPSKSISLSQIARRLRETWPLLASATIVMLAFVTKELSTTAALQSPLPSPALGEWLVFVAHWMTSGVAAVASNRLAPSAVFHDPLVWVGMAALVAAAAATIRGTRSAAVWGSIVVLLLACGIQIAIYRLAQIGLVINNDPRYHEGDILVLAVLLPAAWLTAGRPLPQGRFTTGLLLAAFVGSAVLWATGWVTSIHALKRVSVDGNAPTLNFSSDIALGSTAKVTIETLRTTLRRFTGPDQKAPPSIIDGRTPAGFSPYADQGLEGIVRVFVPRSRVNFYSTSGIPLTIDDQGFAREVEIRNPHDLLGKRISCIETSKSSGWLGPGSAGVKFDLPRGYGEKGPVVIDFPFAKATAGGTIAFTSLPSKSKFPDEQIEVNGVTRGIRIIVPGGTLAIAVTAWGGLRTCIDKPQAWEVAPTNNQPRMSPRAAPSG